MRTSIFSLICRQAALSLLTAAALCAVLPARPALAADWDQARAIPIQHGGRVKSLEAFSREAVEVITGREKWHKQAPAWSILNTVLNPEEVRDLAWIRVDHPGLKEQLRLEIGRKFFSYAELESSIGAVEALARSAADKRDKDQRPSLAEQKAEHLIVALRTLRQLMTGAMFKVLPGAPASAEWLTPDSPAARGPLRDRFLELSAAFTRNDAAAFGPLTDAWILEVHNITRGQFRQSVQLEALYYRVRPFERAWMCYLAVFLLLTFWAGGRLAALAGTAAALLGIFFHTGGILLRCLVLMRPPVSNMYESMFFMNWVLITAAAVFALYLRNRHILAVGALISALVMIYGNLLPIDANMGVLVPVLRSNYWLTIHVMTIVASYGLFGLAMGLGHWYLIRDRVSSWSREEQARMDGLLCRTIQIGVLLLGAGTILGGVWANESWGRFWGWDPKETWALITFLGYLAVVHLKYVNRVTTRGLAFAAVLGFLLVLMTWYGVNFVLGRGLHSYGQGSGGAGWIVAYLAAEFAFVFWALAPSKPKKL